MGGRDYLRLALAHRPSRCNLKTTHPVDYRQSKLGIGKFTGPNRQHILPPAFDAHVRDCALLLPQNSQSTQAMPLGDYFMYRVASNGLRPFRPKFGKLYLHQLANSHKRRYRHQYTTEFSCKWSNIHIHTIPME